MELTEILDPKKSLLLVWDVQHMLVDRIFNKESFLEKTREVIAAARAADVPVVFSKITPLPERFESPVRKYFFRQRMASPPPAANAFDLVLEPLSGDIVTAKNTASMFIGTNFELLLRNAGISTLVLTGIATEIGIESTARDAGNRGIFPVIVSDAVSSSDEEAHLHSLENMKKLSIILPAAELVSVWK